MDWNECEDIMKVESLQYVTGYVAFKLHNKYPELLKSMKDLASKMETTTGLRQFITVAFLFKMMISWSSLELLKVVLLNIRAG